MPRNPEIPTPPPENNPPAMEYGELTAEEKERLELLDTQFHTPQIAEIPMPEHQGKTMRSEYVILDARSDAERQQADRNNEDAVVFIPGHGASYRSPEQLAKMLALKEHKRVLIMSNPATGQTDVPPDDWRDQNDFHLYAETLHNTLEAIHHQETKTGSPPPTGKINLVGSSMGALVAAEYATRHPDAVANLTLLHPAGIRRGFGKLVAGNKLESLSSLIQSRQEAKQAHADTNAQRQAYNELWGDTAKLRLVREVADDHYKQLLQDTPGDTLPEKLAHLWDDDLERQLQELGPDALQQTYTLEQQQLADNLTDEGTTINEQYPDMPLTMNLDTVQNQYIDARKNVEKQYGADSAVNGKNFKWRLWEALTIARGQLPGLLKKIDVPINVVISDQDKMFPAKSFDKTRQELKAMGKSVNTSTVHTKHNDIQRDARTYAAYIGGFIAKNK